MSDFKNTLPLNKLFKRASAEIGNVFYHMLFVKEKKYIYIYSVIQEILIFELFIEIKFIVLI